MFSAVVVLFNPNSLVISNISSFADSVACIYVIDNSSFSNENLFYNVSYKNKLKYVFNNENKGIATALNIGCQLAIEAGMEWVLTMDQDSTFLNFSSEVISFILNNDSKAALYYPNYIIEGQVYDKYIKEAKKPIVVMTSGNLINLSVYEKVLGFEDKLFIDYVDIDYCLKLKKLGYKIENLPMLKLKHELGQSFYKSFFSYKAIVTNHSSLRRYYITRNRLYVSKKYRKVSAVFYQAEKRIFINDILKIIFFEKNKFSKFKSVIRGYLDYKNNNYGIFKK
jgi:rhamnosyltransferase